MIAILALIPWVITVLFLLLIMKNKKYSEDGYDEYDHDHTDPDLVRIAVYKDKAYWVHNNIFYQSEITWEPDFTTAQPIDTMSLSSKEITDLLLILDELEEQGKG